MLAINSSSSTLCSSLSSVVGVASVAIAFIVATVISGVVAKFVEGVGGASVVAVFIVAAVISGVVAKFVEGVGGA